MTKKTFICFIQKAQIRYEITCGFAVQKSADSRIGLAGLAGFCTGQIVQSATGMGVENDARRWFPVHQVDERQHRKVLDDIADIPSVVDMAIVHPQPVPEPVADRNGDVEILLQAGYAAESVGDFPGAVRRYRAALSTAPDNAEAWSALGQALAQTGDADMAAEALTTALALDHGRSDLALLLADIYRGQGRLADAEDELWTFLRLTPGSRSVLQTLAEILGAQLHYEAAAALGRELSLLGPMPGAFTKQFCGWLAETGAHREAIQHLTRHLSDYAKDSAGWLQLGNLWLEVQEPQKAAAAWVHYRELCPGDPAKTTTQLAAYRDAAPSPDYVRALFDGCADSFDHDLQDKLHYRSPELLRKAVGQVWNGAATSCDILDLGCGTGLAGKAFAPHIRHLVGVDLSPKMLSHAEATGLYHELAAADIVSWMNATERRFDLVLAADVMVYLGDLTPLFTAVRRVLRPGGLFAATVEQLPSTEDKDFLLLLKRRYAHSEDYLRRVVGRCGLQTKTIDSCTPRHEGGHPVAGLLLVAAG